MQIHFIRSGEMSPQYFIQILSQLRSRPGPVHFVNADYIVNWDENDFTINEGIAYLTKKQMYEKCHTYRADRGIPDAIPVVLLTDYPETEYWFSAGEYGGKRNFFIHTAGWDSFVESDPQYPVIYEIASIPLFVLAYPDYENAMKVAHMNPQGCYLDMCQYKPDIQLKMRTADICQSCRKHFMEIELHPAIVRQVLSIFEDVRTQMLYRERLEMLQEPSTIEVDEDRKTLFFPSVHRIPVKLTPQEMTVYVFFLNHPQGVLFKDLEKYREELSSIYRQFSPRGELTDIRNSVDRLIKNPRIILNPVITRINSKITKKVGARIDKYYHIIGGGKKHRIAIPEMYVSRIKLRI